MELLSQEGQSKGCNLVSRGRIWQVAGQNWPSRGFHPAIAPHLRVVWTISLWRPYLKVSILPASEMVWPNCQRPPGPSISAHPLPDPLWSGPVFTKLLSSVAIAYGQQCSSNLPP